MLDYKIKSNKNIARYKIAVLILTVLNLITLSILIVLKSNPPKAVFPQQVYGTKVNTIILNADSKRRPSIKRQIKYIVIHETANTDEGADAESHSNFLNSNQSSTTSWHYTVDDTEIYHHIPDDEIAWHTGDGQKKNGGNSCGIGIELCVNSDGNFEATFDNAAKLTAYLLKEYRLNIGSIKQHGDFVQKDCPYDIRNSNRWQEFLDRVKYYLKQKNK